jgi:uncharacterized protein (TIGR03905 family)
MVKYVRLWQEQNLTDGRSSKKVGLLRESRLCEEIGMPQFQFKPKGVCSMNITFSIDEGKVHDVSFQGGCNGNLKAVSKLVEGQDAKHIIEVLKGNDCGGRGTSCADQFAIGLEQALEQM